MNRTGPEDVSPPVLPPGPGPARLRSGRGAMAMAALAAAVLGAGCGQRSRPQLSHVAVNPPGGGAVFTYPVNDQYDVPVGARVLLTFSSNVATPVDTTCTRTATAVTGGFCVEGPDGFVPGVLVVSGTSLAFTPSSKLAPGATYSVWARPALLAAATNLPTDAPLFTFHTRTTRVRARQAATVVTVNGTPMNADGTSAQVFLDRAPLRLLFSEPLDPATVTPATVRLVHVSDGAVVDGLTVAHDVHLTYQPSAPLTPGDAYELQLGAAVHDRGGEAITPVAVKLTPRRMVLPGYDFYPLPLDVTPAWTDGVGQPASRLGVMPVNASILSAPLVGTNVMGAVAGGLTALAGDPQVMGSPLPMLIPRGQRLDLSSMDIRYGGVLDANLKTGTVHFTMLTDALGFLMRNPYRAPDQQPDDVEAPTWVDFTMDAVLTSEDDRGNVIATQTVMGVRVLGISTLQGMELAIEQVGVMDFDLLGVDTAPIALALRFRTGAQTAVPKLGVPFLISSFPAAAAVDVSPADPIELNFSGPLDSSRIRDGLEVKLTQGSTPIATSTRLEGATLVVVPSQRLAEGATFTLSYAGLYSLAGEPVGSGSVTFTTAVTSGATTPPIVTALVPGAPCALTGASATSGGTCVGGQSSEAPYLPFTLPANRDVHVVFSQPMDLATVNLGTACDVGSVRVEQLDGLGRCTGVVAGTLVKRERELRFVPNAPWTPGGSYRVTLVAGTDKVCDTGELCGRNHLPLDTDPLNSELVNWFDGSRSPVPGGPPIVVAFTGAPATVDTYQPLASSPVADTNGSGFIDATELGTTSDNRVVMEVKPKGFSGQITDAYMIGDCMPPNSTEARPGNQACSYLNATLPSSIGGVLPSCPIDAAGNPSSASNPCLQVQVFPSTIVGTSIRMHSLAIDLIPVDTSTGQLVMRLHEDGGPIYGYIMREAGAANPVFVINQTLYLDAPEMGLPVGSTHDLHGKTLKATLKGPVTFQPDGRMNVALRSTADVPMSVGVTIMGKPGTIELLIPAGEMRVTIAGPPLR